MIIWDDEGLILSSINYSETSLILKVFTCNHGVQKGFVKLSNKNKRKYQIIDSNLDIIMNEKYVLKKIEKLIK